MAAEAIVVDASAAMSVVRSEPVGASCGALLQARARAGQAIAVPNVFWVEIVNACARRHGMNADRILEVIAAIDALGITTIEAGRAAVPSLMDISVAHGLTAYDAAYLALAESLGAELLTLDAELAAAARSRSVALAHEIGESRPLYRLEPWISWSGARGYLDAVRRSELDVARR